ncbi:MAG: hypothetical protein HY219_02260 [Candidatus Staskawiczbacteria bacterium]|nr:hypothetical protein [Candidatus Staskawiczbacteria bacterium]
MKKCLFIILFFSLTFLTVNLAEADDAPKSSFVTKESCIYDSSNCKEIAINYKIFLPENLKDKVYLLGQEQYLQEEAIKNKQDVYSAISGIKCAQFKFSVYSWDSYIYNQLSPMGQSIAFFAIDKNYFDQLSGQKKVFFAFGCSSKQADYQRNIYDDNTKPVASREEFSKHLFGVNDRNNSNILFLQNFTDYELKISPIVKKDIFYVFLGFAPATKEVGFALGGTKINYRLIFYKSKEILYLDNSSTKETNFKIPKIENLIVQLPESAFLTQAISSRAEIKNSVPNQEVKLEITKQSFWLKIWHFLKKIFNF